MNLGIETPYSALFRDSILQAKNLGASDVHFQPTRSGLDIRLRVDGEMLHWHSISDDHRLAFLNQTKKEVQFQIAVSGKAQDGRVSFPEWKLDLRASLLPSQFGEKIVLRLLDLNRKFELDQIGFDNTTLSDLHEALRSQNGVLLISGPTGSGKTTTLYTLLSALNAKTRNIITLEDPIEYSLPGLTQVQINRKLTFADALRSVLRQDPDVILVGEIRDLETADLCLKAAATGHLVLSTLHANGARQVVDRLVQIGVDANVLDSVLRFSAAQRLLRKLCADCSVPDPEAGLPFRKRNLAGCKACRDGILGRVPILEYLKKTGHGSSLIVSLREAALHRAGKGEVDYEEACQVE